LIALPELLFSPELPFGLGPAQSGNITLFEGFSAHLAPYAFIAECDDSAAAPSCCVNLPGKRIVACIPSSFGQVHATFAAFAPSRSPAVCSSARKAAIGVFFL